MANVNEQPLAESSPFTEEFLKEVCSDACTSTIGDSEFVHSDSAKWNDAIIQRVLEKLKSNKNKKYLVYVTTISKGIEGSTGIRTTLGALWNVDKDGSWTHRWASDHVEVVFTIVWVTTD